MRFAARVLAMSGLIIGLMIALSMIRGTVDDRQKYRTEAVAEVARSTAGAQVLGGPVLYVPYTDRVVTMQPDATGLRLPVEEFKTGTWMFFPDVLQVQGTIRPVPRMRGLYEVRVFELDTNLQATFSVQLPPDDDPSSPRTIGKPRLGIGISDVRGLVGTPSLRVAGVQHVLLQGHGQGGSGLHALLAAPKPDSTLGFDVEFKATLQGTETLSVSPLATRNVFALDSTWPHPQFHGSFLPRTRTIGADGFRARWEISSLATDAQSQFRAGPGRRAAGTAIDVVSVSLVDPVNVYSQVDRATKYGVLFVLLTFVAFFMFEVLAQLRIHPVQYGLVGLAIALFFLLLLALSERVPFGAAYVVAACACVSLIGHYLGHVLGRWSRGAGFAGMLGTLYAALYGLLISEDNAMVLGAGLLFVILAAIMVLTRKVDWYRAALAAPATDTGSGG